MGYSNGSVILWDLTRAVIAKSITTEHSEAIVHAVFLWQDYQAARQMKAITGDCKGLVLLHTFTIVPLLRRVTLTTQVRVTLFLVRVMYVFAIAFGVELPIPGFILPVCTIILHLTLNVSVLPSAYWTANEMA